MEEGGVRNRGREMKWRGERKKGKERERSRIMCKVSPVMVLFSLCDR